MTKKAMHIGLDDTDSTRQGCTTYVAALLVEKIEKLGAEFVDYPNLIRLNPNVPWKTRGNGALCLRIRYEGTVETEIKETVIDTVEKHSDVQSAETDPGLVFFGHAQIPEAMKLFATRTITGVVAIREALPLLKKFGAEAVGFKNGRGIIGALAAIGETLGEDHTYEIIAYRVPENYGLKRRVDESSVFEMDKATRPYTFNNVDLEKRRVIVTPRGPDPILFGVRGESPRIVKRAFDMIRSFEPIERWVIFRTNQGTDAHLRQITNISDVQAHSPAIVRGTVSANPRTVPLRHVIFSIKDSTAEIDCAAYEPSGTLRCIARELVVGDGIEVYGGVRPAGENRPLTINLEKIRVLRLASRITYANPICAECAKRMKSMGKNQGFRCERCGSRRPASEKAESVLKRAIRSGLYIASVRSQRHLTKPFMRYGREKHLASIMLTDGWHSS